ncbi:helix-turn-helix domain-containing protein [Solitalea lacus]|uniref:helix-turn-helix domain-containing protein n=1 Tax=Solitalea lacus TaxID=2911172 RepID=UPI001EDABB9E|nr:helix-turn-helix transcriptional regulator [Solitalea lacus]UKJ09145.1 helix-turn-helix domain-containing protein [Solitalea lacus]
MIFLSSNIKWLRKRAKKSQGILAEQLHITREMLNSYEHGLANPSLQVLVNMADYFGLSTDSLLRINLTTYHELQFRALLEKEQLKGHLEPK